MSIGSAKKIPRDYTHLLDIEDEYPEKSEKNKKSNIAKKSRSIPFATYFDAYEEALESGDLLKIEQTYNELPFELINSPNQIIAAYQCQQLKGNRRDKSFIKLLSKCIEKPRISEYCYYRKFYYQYQDAHNMAEFGENILAKMSSRPVVNFYEVFRLHGMELSENICFICNKSFEGKRDCDEHTSLEHTREEINSQFGEILKSKTSEACYSLSKISTNKIDDDVGGSNVEELRRQYPRISKIASASSEEVNQTYDEGNAAKSNMEVFSVRLRKKPKRSSEYAELKLQSNNLKTSNQNSMIIYKSPSLQLQACPCESKTMSIEISNVEKMNSKNIIPKERSTGSSSMLTRKDTQKNYCENSSRSSLSIEQLSNQENNYTLKTDLTLIVTHQNYPDYKLSESNFDDFLESIAQVISISGEIPKWEIPMFRPRDGSFLVLASDIQSKEWLCTRIIDNELLKEVPLKIQNLFTTSVTIPLFEDCKGSAKILNELKRYNPLLEVDQWYVADYREHSERKKCSLVIQMPISSIETLSKMNFKPHYPAIGRVRFHQMNADSQKDK